MVVKQEVTKKVMTIHSSHLLRVDFCLSKKNLLQSRNTNTCNAAENLQKCKLLLLSQYESKRQYNLALHRVQLSSAKTNSNRLAQHFNSVAWDQRLKHPSRNLLLLALLPTRVPATPAQPHRGHPAASNPSAKTTSRRHLVPARTRLQTGSSAGGSGEARQTALLTPPHEKGTALHGASSQAGPSRPKTAARAIRTA